MMVDPYNSQVRELFADTRHAGPLADAVRVTNDAQGVAMELLATAQAGRVKALRYRVRGCPHSIAACEAICRELEGEAVSSLEKFSVMQLMQSLAVPAAKSGRILALEDTVRRLELALREAQTSAEQDI
ncbi:MAG: iron-sulfur cluster assembly scaffold protein [Woeseiaceae bacterium]